MKKIISISIFASLCAGCSLGFNQNVATIDGQQYLISTPVYSGPLMLGQWQGKSNIKKLEAEDLNNQELMKEVKKFIRSCRYRRGRIMDYESFFNCVNQKADK